MLLNIGIFRISVLWLLAVLLSTPAEAKLFQNSYVSFELPDRWSCTLEGTEYVCRSEIQSAQKPDPASEAIIILTAKEVGPTDSLQAYEAHLKTPRSILSRQGASLMSEVKRVEVRNINSHPWVDGLHLNSEIPSYLTRYLATVKDRIAIGVTLSAHKAHYPKYANDFIRAIESLRVIAIPGFGQAGGADGTNGGGMFGSTGGGNIALPEGVDPGFEDPDLAGSGKSSKQSEMLIGLAVIIGAIAVYLLVKRKK